ncbi:MAG: diaminopimelate decarboxylase, partial [Burkholderiales bacterium]|nr:diaminopimelate decarboxylase [Burkholderiales bacterium]
LANQGCGADIVSEGELERALRAGFRADAIVFSGVGKSEAALEKAIEIEIRQINVESECEFARIAAIASRLGKRPSLAIRINPDVDARTHSNITTGRKTDKFGLVEEDAFRLYERASCDPHVDLRGLALHIGSQVSALDAFEEAFRRVALLTARLRARGNKVDRIDLGGGVPSTFPGDTTILSRYVAIIERSIGHLRCEILLEPGRFLVANAGVLITEVLLVKHMDSNTVVVINAAMNDFIRPALYGAEHDVVAVQQELERSRIIADVVGPVCESSDTFCRAKSVPGVGRGDLLALLGAGAYGASMSSTYNARPLVPEVLVHGSQHALIRKRVSIEDQMAIEPLAPWLCTSQSGWNCASRQTIARLSNVSK